ncbi:hypothetical protein SDC9_193284 [bioreactor metagenome]|uniref:Uncharacterized protein n=1 Tax=bioreactor metagenome TaxID=1076179 RepID=A0A645IBN7_9ZZZZ
MLKPPVFGKEKSDSIILELEEQSFRIALFELGTKHGYMQ